VSPGGSSRSQTRGTSASWTSAPRANETNPNGEVILEVGPGVTSATIDGEYLSPGSNYAAELIALERSGNQTIAAFEFKTSG